MIELHHGPVQAIYYNVIPKKNETIDDYVHIDRILEYFKYVKYYFRDKEMCPMGRGSWVIDFFKSKNDILPSHCIKFNPEISKERMHKFMKPLIDKVKEKMN